MIPYIDYSRCTGCRACAELYPAFFIIKDDVAWVINHEMFDPDRDKNIIYCCPFRAITIE